MLLIIILISYVDSINITQSHLFNNLLLSDY